LFRPLFIWGIAVWGVATGVGLLRLYSWARTSAILLAVVGGVVFFPVGPIFAAFVLAYLLRKDIGRLFELGEGPVTLPDDEARRVERVLGSRTRSTP
jgi:hypothetical protein